MERHIDILEKYYEEIRENSQLDIDPKGFAVRCVRLHNEKRRKERERERDIKKAKARETLRKKQAYQAERRKALKIESLAKARIEYEKKKKAISTQKELIEFGESTSRKYLMVEGDRKKKVLKDLAILVDIIRG